MLSGMEPSATQREVIEYADGPVMVIAPPGSGKTYTLVERVRHLISKKGVPAERILTLTFTTKAAKEIGERLKSRLGQNAALLYSSTFHALALDMLRRYGEPVGVARDFSVVATTEEKEDANMLTFDELLSYALRLLNESSDARAYWQGRFDYVLADEYQDTNDVQDEIVSILAKRHANICAIGDPDQAIYGFRGANIENFLQFERRYPSVKRMYLDRNYRSRPCIVGAAHGLICRNEKRLMSNCPDAHRAHTETKITLARFSHPREEARYIARSVESLIGGVYHSDVALTRGIKTYEGMYQPADVAVLYRLKALGSALANAFDEAGIPYVLVTEIDINDVVFDTFRVSLMTMHAAKGMEFPVVFVTGLEDGVTPYCKENAENDMEEERRLFYVAMTRAKERLFLTHSAERMLFGKKCTTPSRFLSEIPPEYTIREEIQKSQKPFQRKLF